LEQFLSGLSPEDWQRPSQCERWQVADVVAHLIEDQHAERLTRGLQGDLTPSGFVPNVTLNEDDFREHVVQHPITLRRQLGDELLDAFCAENDQVDTTLAGLQAEDWETLCYHPRRPEPIRTIIGIRLMELAMHGWDIRASFDPQAALSEDTLPSLLQAIPRVVRRAFRPDANRTRAVRYRLQIPEPVPATIDILLNADGAFVASDRQAEADVTFYCETSTAILVLFGRLPLADAIADGRVDVEGEPELAAAFGQSFQGG
ncbi:MAG: maleylpyruvate isomerase family mycothiol-dependent enzyme, partial [Candidatus Tectomicrobia bacterium]|nr:maleylpyruvate isomerase family mycothiol-dependent enzyme [Candidatus Tectomicrobia bacterium]